MFTLLTSQSPIGWLKEVELFGFGDLSGKDSAEVCFTWDGELPEGTDQRDTYKSKQDFGIFNNLSPNDDFSLLVYDLKSGKTGEIRSWSMTFGSFTNSWSPVEDITPVFGNITNYRLNGERTYTSTISDRNCDLDLDIDVDYWIPNIELENVIERAVILSPGHQLELGDWIPKRAHATHKEEFDTLEAFERKYILEVLQKTAWRVSGEKGAAKILGMKPTTLESRMKKLGIKRGLD